MSEEIMMNKATDEKAKRRGRPRKNPIPSVGIEEETCQQLSLLNESEDKPAPRKRGRPKKQQAVEKTDSTAADMNKEDSDSDIIYSAVKDEMSNSDDCDDKSSMTETDSKSYYDEPLLSPDNTPSLYVVGSIPRAMVKQLKMESERLEINASRATLKSLCSMQTSQMKARIAAENQLSAILRGSSSIGRDNDSFIKILQFNIMNFERNEKNILKIIETVAENIPVCQWLASIHGIGYKLAAMLVSEIDMDKVQHASSIRSFCGLNSHNSPIYSVQEIEIILNEAGIVKGAKLSPELISTVALMTGRSERRLMKCETRTQLIKEIRKLPYNRTLKTLLYLISDQFVKRSGESSIVDGKCKSLYGGIYRAEKARMTLENEAGMYQEAARDVLRTRNISDPELLKLLRSGRLTKIHIDMRARRKALTIFVNHFSTAMFLQFRPGEQVEMPYILQYGGHSDYIEPEVPFEDFFDIPEGGLYKPCKTAESRGDNSKFVRRFYKNDL